MKNTFGILVLILGLSMSLLSCSTTEKSPFPQDELPKGPQTAALDPAYVLIEQAKAADASEYKQALTRSRGFLFNMRVMLVTEPLLKAMMKESPHAELSQAIQSKVVDRTCFRFENDTADKKAIDPAQWQSTFVTLKDETLPLTMTVDPDTVSDPKARTFQVRGDLCADKKLEVLPGFTVSLTPMYEKKPEPLTFVWSAWKPGISQAPTRVRW